jgi:hypothetical protein
MSRPEPDAVLASLLEGSPPEDAARTLAQLVNRAAARLHTLSRAEAAARKEQTSWAQWAQLQNAARALVLQASTARDLASRLPAPSAEPPTPASDPRSPTSEAQSPSIETPPPADPAAGGSP